LIEFFLKTLLILLKSITSNPSHVLRKYLPKLKNTGHNLRP